MRYFHCGIFLVSAILAQDTESDSNVADNSTLEFDPEDFYRKKAQNDQSCYIGTQQTGSKWEFKEQLTAIMHPINGKILCDGFTNKQIKNPTTVSEVKSGIKCTVTCDRGYKKIAGGKQDFTCLEAVRKGKTIYSFEPNVQYNCLAEENWDGVSVARGPDFGCYVTLRYIRH